MTSLKQLKFSRRNALRGIASGIGVSLWLPVLDIMCNDNGTAFAQNDPFPTTFGIFFWGNGVYPGRDWTPSGTGDGNAWELPPSLSDFAALKGDMTYVTGLDMLSAEFKGHGWGVVYVLAGGDGTECHNMGDINRSPYGGLPETAQGTQWMPTIDQLVADAISTAEQPYKSLETGILKYTGQNMGTAGLNLAHTGPNQPLAPERDPAKLFDKLFSAGAPSGATDNGTPIELSTEMRRSALDAVLEDAKRMQQTLGAADAQRIEAHMENVRALEARVASTAGGANPDPTMESGTGCFAPPETTEQAANVDLSRVTATSEAMNQLIAAALSCNMTRVYSHLWSGARDENHYPIINQDSEHHGLTHAGRADEAGQIMKYIMSQYAHLAQTLKDTSIGDSNLLDQTLLYGISDVSEPQGHVMTDYHIILMGHAGGQIPGDRHIRRRGNKVTELMLTMQQVMGMDIDSFGTWDPTNTPFNDIL
jgi:hypothetical protein